MMKFLPAPSEPCFEGMRQTFTDGYVYPRISAGMVKFCTHYVINVLPGIGEPVLTKYEFRP